LVGGGVAANRRLRERLAELAGAESVEVIIASPDLCTDNAAMAAMAWEHLDRGRRAALDLDVSPTPIRKR
jgi:N6-L-threonylcarbamoyladenine synthase